ncbi:MICOS complex subunit MIC19 isoform X2 [Brachionus plicatilis]|uniref:MICOS complex subunit MIC19 isoform X2 n=1 Tax=Brachionus plicatilis TaxID=10195 RepID=A0A3M7S1P4_BRAPC|nr:MICOS complex subunit MIC19 isoform X2 [Brachionus plicatilis]
MGLWGSKQQREIKISNPEPKPEVFVTESAISNVLKTVKDSAKETKKLEEKRPEDFDLRLSTELHDKRISEYEKNMVDGLNLASKQVDELFRERYTTIPVCSELQAKVSKCYSENSDRTLNCLEIANEFIKCVEQERQKKIGFTQPITGA